VLDGLVRGHRCGGLGSHIAIAAVEVPGPDLVGATSAPKLCVAALAVPDYVVLLVHLILAPCAANVHADDVPDNEISHRSCSS
jgi:hypothetical protein